MVSCMDFYQYDWEIVPDKGARLLRVRGQHPSPVLPEQIEGVPLRELGDYCFAPQGRLPERYRTTEAGRDTGSLARPAVDSAETSLRELGGSYLERLVLPDSLRRIGTYAFYNCKRLTSLAVGKRLTDIGSDAFMNCHQLKEIYLRAAPKEKTGVRFMLAQISQDLEVFFEAEGTLLAALFFPEYHETYDEIAPAHLFGRHIVGEGFRARQCFEDGVADFRQYDRIFPKACAGEEEGTLCAIAWDRLRCPFELEEQPGRRYADYLRAHSAALQERFLRERDSGQLVLLGDMGFLSKEEVWHCIRRASAAGWAKGAAELMRMKNRRFPEQKAAARYTFDDEI